MKFIQIDNGLMVDAESAQGKEYTKKLAKESAIAKKKATIAAKKESELQKAAEDAVEAETK